MVGTGQSGAGLDRAVSRRFRRRSNEESSGRCQPEQINRSDRCAAEDGTPGARCWVLRVTINGERRNRGLGALPPVTIDKARDRALEIRRAASDGRDLIGERAQQRANAVTFR